MKHEFIANHRQEFPIKRMCQMLAVSRSGYYDWRDQPLSQREQDNQMLTAQIKQVYQDSRQTYGSPRVHVELNNRGLACGRNRVARLMRQNGIVARGPRRWRPVTTQRRATDPVAPNHLNQNFTTTGPNQKWLADISYIATAEGWLYLAVILDLFSRMVVGWSMASHMESTLVEDALKMALGRRQVGADTLLHHSDRGSQYTSYAYQAHLTSQRIQPSMSRIGNCYDNSPIESFFGTLKTECATHTFVSHAQARATIFEYIEVWYNRRRLHSALDYISPETFEHRFFLEKLTVR